MEKPDYVTYQDKDNIRSLIEEEEDSASAARNRRPNGTSVCRSCCSFGIRRTYW